MSDPQFEQRRAAWQDTDKFHRDTLQIIRDRIDSTVDHAVEYGRLALRTVLELNGGGIIALPSLGTLFGSFWNLGHTLPVIGVLSFLFGVLMAAAGYAFSFFHFMAWERVYNAQYQRKDTILGIQSKAIRQGQPTPEDENKASDDETLYTKHAGRWQAAAIGAALLSLLGFIVGAVITAFVLAWPVATGGGR